MQYHSNFTPNIPRLSCPTEVAISWSLGLYHFTYLIQRNTERLSDKNTREARWGEIGDRVLVNSFNPHVDTPAQ